MSILEKSPNPKAAERIYQSTKNALILVDTPYNDHKILEKVVSIMNRPTNANLPEDEIAKRVIKALKRLPCDARPASKVIVQPIDKSEFLNNFTGPTL